MIRILYFFIFFFIFLTKTYSAIINKITIDGNERITDETIIVFSKIQIGSNLNENQLNQIIKNLYKTNFFKTIELNIDQNNLFIRVEENPLVQSVIYKGIKNKNILNILKDNTQLKEKSSFTTNLVKSDELKISNILKNNGYYLSTVTVKYIENENNTIDLIYDIYLGEKSSIKKIIFTGDKKFKDRKLRGVITSEEDAFWKFISKQKYIDYQRIKFDERLLKNFYKNNGYYNAKILSSSAQVLNDKNFILTFTIDAGEKHYFENLDLALPADYIEDNFTNIYDVLNDLKGKLYSYNKIKKILDQIDKVALNKEFQFINATFKETVKDNKVNILITLFESEKIFIDRINVFGNYITEEKVVRNSLFIDEGDALNQILLKKSINEIKSKGIFKSVDYKLVDVSKNKKTINIMVDEKPTGEIFAGVGTGTSGSNISFGLNEKNFLGIGSSLKSDISLATEGITGSVSYYSPNFKDSDKDLVSSVEILERDFMDDYGYKTNRQGFSLGYSFEQYRDIYFSPSISSYYENLKTSSKASQLKKKQEGNYFEGQFLYGVTLNKLNQNFQPTDGFRTSFHQSIPILSDDMSFKNSYKFSTFYKLPQDVIFSLRFNVDAIHSLNGDDVRVSKRIFMPETRLRGFSSGKIGPKDSGEYIGGNYGSSLNLGATLPEFLKDLENIDFSLFLDMANIWGVDYDSKLDSNKLRSSTGLAVDWFTPIGPLSFSFATALSKADSDTTESFRFNIGTSF